jgi:hypothetical protein
MTASRNLVSQEASPVPKSISSRPPANEALYTWVKLSQHCAATGDTPDAVDKRIRSGYWLRDVHVRKPAGSKQLWVNVEAVNNWAAGRPTEVPKRRRAQA